jgi:glycosyltransferase involved in cell wall biosynthesis
MDFENPPPPPDDYAADFRQAMGLGKDDLLILQPTRVVRRKGIEHSVELLRQLGDPRCKLVITHGSGDEGASYADRVRRYAAIMGVDVIFGDARIAHQRTVAPDGSKRYTIQDAYSHADFVTYPSSYEGFGNAFLEAIYYRQPLLCNRYGIYQTDIEPCGFHVVLMDGFLTDAVVDRVRQLLTDPARRQEMVEHNYEVGRRFFSYQRVADELTSMLATLRLA